MNPNAYYSPSQTMQGGPGGMEALSYPQASSNSPPPLPNPPNMGMNRTYQYPMPSNTSSAHISNLGIPNYFPTSTPSAASGPHGSSAYINSTTPATYPLEHWNELQYMCSIGNIFRVREILSQGGDAEWTSPNRAYPQTSPLHIAVKTGNLELVNLLLNYCNPNKPDQFGFTPLHYATVARHRELVLLLLSRGCNASTRAKNKVTAVDLARNHPNPDFVILNTLENQLRMETDGTWKAQTQTSVEPLASDSKESSNAFQNWLIALGCGEFFLRFLHAGYDIELIREYGLTDEDLDCIGIPREKLGLRKKLKSLFKIDEFAPKDSDEEEESEEDEEESDEEDSDEDSD